MIIGMAIMLLILKATILLAVATGATYLLRRRSAALRHMVWGLALAGVVVLPVAEALSPFTLHLLPAQPAGDEISAKHEKITSDESETREAAAVVHDVGAPESTLDASAIPATPVDWSRVLMGFWLAGALALLGRYAIGMRRVRRIVRRADPVTHPNWIALAPRVFHEDVRRPLELRISEEVDMPFASGLVRPTIVLPASSSQWSPERREAVLLHELAHLSRGDLLMNALSHVARALYWFHPLAWYASHRLRIEGERASDDVVLGRGAKASDYADHLLSIATGAGTHIPSAALAMARRSAFEGRLLAILEPGIERVAPSRLRVAGTIAAFLFVILPLAAASPTAKAAAMSREQDPPPSEPAPAQTSVRASSAVLALIDALTDASAAVRLAAVNSLGSLEDPRAIAALGKALREDSDPRVRHAAADALGQIDDPRALPHLLDALKTERVADVREQIVEALREIDDASAVSAVIAVAKDPSAKVRRAAVSALGEFEDQAAVPTLITMARDDDVEVRRNVANALGNLENPAALDALVAMSRDADAEVRSHAINALGNLEDPRTLNALVAALKDANSEVRSQAADAIHNIPDIKTAPRQLIDALADPDHDVRHNVAHALGGIGDDAAVPALKRALSDPNAEVRRTVVESLSDIGGPEAITALMGLLKDQDPEVRRIAAEALGKRR